MKSSELNQVKELLESFVTFKEINPEATLEAFGRFLTMSAREAELAGHDVDSHSHNIDQSAPISERLATRLSQIPFGQDEPLPGSGLWFENRVPIQGKIGILLRRLVRHSNGYMRMMMDSLGMRNVEDYTYLSYAFHMAPCTKTDLISAALSEFTGGIEIINRLVKAGFLTEQPHPDDKRKKQIVMTDHGLEVLHKSRQLFEEYKMGEVVFGILSEQDQQLLYEMLASLDHVHTHLARQRSQPAIQSLSTTLEHLAKQQTTFAP